MEVAAKCEGRELELFLQGELDHHGAKGLLQRLDREIETALPLRLTLDFSAVTFMDSSGIAVAMRAAADARAGRHGAARARPGAAGAGVPRGRNRQMDGNFVRGGYICGQKTM